VLGVGLHHPAKALIRRARGCAGQYCQSCDSASRAGEAVGVDPVGRVKREIQAWSLFASMAGSRNVRPQPAHRLRRAPSKRADLKTRSCMRW
jgi:hypothetical protein